MLSMHVSVSILYTNNKKKIVTRGKKSRPSEFPDVKNQLLKTAKLMSCALFHLKQQQNMPNKTVT